MVGSVGRDVSQAVGLTKYFVSLPRSRHQALIIALISIALAGLLAYVLGMGWLEAALSGFLLILIPAVMSALMFRILRSVMLKRSMFLMLIASLLYFMIYAVFFITSSLDLLILGYSGIFIIVFLGAYFVFRLRYSAIALSMVQLFFFGLMLYYLSFITSSPSDLLPKLALASLIFASLSYVLIYIINAPLKKAFSISSSRAFSMFVSQWLYDSKDLEKEFDRIGAYSNTYIDALYLRNSSGTCLISIPQVHFGPFGSLGGSDFTTQIARSLEGQGIGCAVVMHGACTHDQNPTTSAQLRRITDPLSKFIREAESSASPAMMAFVETKHASASARHLILNDSVLSSFSRHPQTTEDMDFGLGLLLREMGRSRFGCSMIADEHNAETGEITQFLLGSDEAHEYVCAMEELRGCRLPALRVAKAGFGNAYGPDGAHGIGGNGVSVVCLTVGRTSVVYVIIDANGITIEAKRAFESALHKHFTHAVIMTTDTHALNKVSGVVNPFGSEDYSHIIGHIAEKAASFKRSASPFKCYAKTVEARVKIFGPRQSLKLIGTVNSIVAMTKLVAPLLILFGALFAVWALSMI